MTSRVETLIQLSQDEQADVRDWATFALAREIERDTPGLRDALLARLGDPDPDVRAEALAGLAARKDRRAIEALLAELDSAAEGPGDPCLLTGALLALATESRDARLCRRVRAERDRWAAAEPAEPLPAELERALHACAER